MTRGKSNEMKVTNDPGRCHPCNLLPWLSLHLTTSVLRSLSSPYSLPGSLGFLSTLVPLSLATIGSRREPSPSGEEWKVGSEKQARILMAFVTR